MKTSKSLLLRAQTGGSDAWDRIVNLYQPLIRAWLSRYSVSSNDSADITQDVLLALSQELPNFEHNGRIGAFRNWLCQITLNRCRRYWESSKNRNPKSGSDSVYAMIQQLEDPSSELSERWAAEHDAHVLKVLLKSIDPEFDRETMTAFRKSAIESLPAAQIAKLLNWKVGQVYKAKFQVMTRLRQEAEGLIGEENSELIQ